MNCPLPLKLILLLALALWLVPSTAAAEKGESPPDDAPVEASPVDEDEPSVAPPDPEAELLASASAIAERVAEIRQLPRLAEIPKGVQDREQLRAMLIERFEEEVPQDVFLAEERVFQRVGLFPADLDYRELMLDLLTEQIAGFYDQSAKELYIMAGLPERVQKPAMAHEIFHAIQDQHFDIGALLAPFESSENADFSLARMALIEGDATVLMIDYELYEQGVLPQNRARSIIDIPALAAVLMEMDATQLAAVEQMEESSAIDLGGDAVPSLTDSVLGNSPPIVRDSLLFPYVDGMRFVIRARAGRSWSEFNEIYGDAPLSTSQILHPERYFEEDAPVEVRFSAAGALPDHEVIYDTVFGEMRMRSWLKTHLSEEIDSFELDEIAAGWDGDRIRGYQRGDDELLVATLSSWRSVEQAQAFAEAMKKSASLRHDAASSHRAGDYGEAWTLRFGPNEDGERIFIERWGEMVLYVEGLSSRLDDEGQESDPTLLLVRDSIWDSLARVPFDEVLAARLAEMNEAEERPAAQ